MPEPAIRKDSISEFPLRQNKVLVEALSNLTGFGWTQEHRVAQLQSLRKSSFGQKRIFGKGRLNCVTTRRYNDRKRTVAQRAGFTFTKAFSSQRAQSFWQENGWHLVVTDLARHGEPA
jgi:hypothetical protein